MISPSYVTPKEAVIGLGFGDEGKGKVVSYLCSTTENPLVLRFSGGQQAGHHVRTDTHDHIFASFGSGTLSGYDTYIMPYCTVDPCGILNELDVLLSKGISPRLYIDKKCPVTTPFEHIINKTIDIKNDHGTCGVGVGRTHQREKDHYSLLIEDLFFPSVLKIKLYLIKRYYEKDYVLLPNTDNMIQRFVKECDEFINWTSSQRHIGVVDGIPYKGQNYTKYIFEGSQGLLLDQNFGFFPHVTRSDTGTKNLIDYDPNVYLVTRAYQTRHGYGPMTNEDIIHTINKNPFEQNYDDGIQGEFRRTILDLDLLKYAISKDEYISRCLYYEWTRNKINLVITCMDLVNSPYMLTLDGKLKIFKTEFEFVNYIKKELNIDKVWLSRSPLSDQLERYS